jgi:hypothetical protein
MRGWNTRRLANPRSTTSVVMAIALLFVSLLQSQPIPTIADAFRALETTSVVCSDHDSGDGSEHRTPAPGHVHDQCCCLPHARQLLHPAFAIIPHGALLLAFSDLGVDVRYDSAVISALRPFRHTASLARGPPTVS